MKIVRKKSIQCSSGTVYLVGAGPGDIELITVKGSRCLAQAQVVVYDRLVNKELLSLTPPGCELVYAGKRKHLHAMTQQAIQETLVSHARAGKVVLRLKGGDPMIFGRGGEEIDALNAAGIAWEIVPGITAATGAAAQFGLPLTQRHQSQALTFVTAQCHDGELQIDWPLLLHCGQTVVVYMGLSLLHELTSELIQRGKSPDTAFAVIANATREDAKLVQGSLANIAELSRRARLASPALLVMGVKARDTVALRVIQQQCAV